VPTGALYKSPMISRFDGNSTMRVVLR
jgi:hypothetical protein